MRRSIFNGYLDERFYDFPNSVTSVGVTPLGQVTLILPRSDLSTALRELADFDRFHAAPASDAPSDPVILELSSRALRLATELREAAEGLRLQREPSLLDVIFRGAEVNPSSFTACDWEDLVSRVETEARPLLDELNGFFARRHALEKELADAQSLRTALALISGFSIDLSVLERFQRLRAVLALASQKDVPELQSSLPGVAVLDEAIGKSQAAVLVIGLARDALRIEKVFRGLDVKPFTLPPALSQNPATAYTSLAESLPKLEEDFRQVSHALEAVRSRVGERLLALQEAASMAHTVLEQLKKTGGLRRVAILRGFVPAEDADDLRSRCAADWLCFFEAVPIAAEHTADASDVHGASVPAKPALMRHSRVTQSFANVTLTQGPPRYDELDPTPIIAAIFPIFYGIMFGDMGHGLILLAFGLFLRMRKHASLRAWGQMMAYWGVAATIVGVLIGEFFGLEIANLPGLQPIGELTVLHFVVRPEANGAPGLPTIFAPALKLMLKFSILLGATHLVLGLVLNIMNGLRRRRLVETVVEPIPLLGMYVGLLLFIFGFLGAEAPVRRAPEIFGLPGVTLEVVGAPALMLLLGFLTLYIVGKPIAIKLGRLPPEPLGMVVMINVIEGLFERLPGFFANTVSYVRLAILLAVHAALLIALNLAWSQPLIVALPIVIVFNILIMIMEGLIVFIQALRLHLYEWFTKFYEGSGELFRELVPRSSRVRLEWLRPG